MQPRQMTASATQPARLVCHTALLGDSLAGRGSSPKVPPRCHLPRGFEAGWEHPRIPWQGREGRQCPEAAREGRKEEGTGPGSGGARPVGAAWLFSMGGAYLCPRLGLITGTCLQPRRLPAGLIASNWAGLGSPEHPCALAAAGSPAQAALPQCHPTVLVALAWGPCASRGWGQAGTASPPPRVPRASQGSN